MKPLGAELCVHVSAQGVFLLYKELHLKNYAYFIICLGFGLFISLISVSGFIPSGIYANVILDIRQFHL